MDTRVADVTVRVVLPEILPNVAVTITCPTATGAARPLKPIALLIVARASSEELHVTSVVMSFMVPSEKVPVAAN